MCSVKQQLDVGTWVASFGVRSHSDVREAGTPTRAFARTEGAGGSYGLHLAGESGRALPAGAEDAGCAVVFDGVLYNRVELAERLADLRVDVSGDADLILRAYLRWGEDVLPLLKGVFALCIWDSKRDLLLCARDPVGVYPLFYATDGHDLLLSTSIEALVQHPRVSRAVNRAALVERMCRRWSRVEETCFTAVKRVPAGHAMHVGSAGRRLYRYWDPFPPSGQVKWITDDEIGRFDELLTQAVDRCMEAGPASIYLSGGIDSVAVATAAADSCRRRGLRIPLALSLVFPQASEEAIQKAVAADLGLPQVLASMADLVGPDGLLWSAVEASAELSSPLLNLWYPAYVHLGLQGKQQGCRVILTGGGGDEWLDVSPNYAADLLRDLDLVKLYRLWDCWRKSFPISGRMAARNVLWKFGARPLLGRAGRWALNRVAPATLSARRRRRFAREMPPWLAPEPALRQELYERSEENVWNAIPGGFYLNDLYRFLNHPVITMEFEEYFEEGRRMGARLLYPFWDVDVVDFLYRMPPHLLYKGGRSKGFVRERLATRFPALGFEHQKKLIALDYFYSLLRTEGLKAWQRMGGAPALTKLGIVDAAALDSDMTALFRGARPRDTHRIRDVLFAEAWLRPRL